MNEDKLDLIWGIEQMEKALAKTHSPASNIMSICTEVKKQVNEIITKGVDTADAKTERMKLLVVDDLGNDMAL